LTGYFQEMQVTTRKGMVAFFRNSIAKDVSTRPT